MWPIRPSVYFSKHCTLGTPRRKDGWAALLGYYSHIYLETVGRVLEVRNNSSQRLVPSLRKRRRTTMGHLTVMKSMGTCWQIHLEPQRKRERGLDRERSGRWGSSGGAGWCRQWLNTGLTIKATPVGVFFEVLSSAESAVTRCNLQETARRRGRRQEGTPDFMWLTNWHKAFKTLPATCPVLVNYLSLCNSFIPLFLSCVPSVELWWGWCWSQCLQPAVKTAAEGCAGNTGCKPVHAFDDCSLLVCIYVFKLPSTVHIPNDRGWKSLPSHRNE